MTSERLRAMPHMPGLDGLRAVAVAAVVLYHLGLSWMPGGFLGVDVFFVLSGFLITTLLIEEMDREGRLDLKRFYVHRGRRLLPALWLMLFVVSTVSLVFLPAEVPELRGDVTAALFYVSNWDFIVADQSYFEMTGRPPLLQHLWSLAVEEQFYLLWPVVLAVAMVGGRRSIRRVALIIAAFSAVWMAVLSVSSGFPVPNDPSRVYFGTDTHASGLLLGAALAASWRPWRSWRSSRSWVTSRRPLPHRRGVAALDFLGMVALALVVYAFIFTSEFSEGLFRGGFFAVSAVTAMAVAAVVHPGGVLGRLLGIPPLRWLGERSYAIYLWHWPVLMLTRPGIELGFHGLAANVVRIAIVLVLADLSYRLVEHPIRTGSFRRRLHGRGTVSSRGPAYTRLAGATTVLVATLVVGNGLATATAPDPADPPAADVPTASLPAPETVTPPEPAAPQPASPQPAAPPPATPWAFGDSVMVGAAELLGGAGMRVSAAVGRQFGDVAAEVVAAADSGQLGQTVVLHVGNNGPLPEKAVRGLLERITDRQVLILTVHAPRNYERYNNELLTRVAQSYANVRLLDWHALAAANPSWLARDHIHLTAKDGRQGYAAWLVGEICPIAPAGRQPWLRSVCAHRFPRDMLLR